MDVRLVVPTSTRVSEEAIVEGVRLAVERGGGVHVVLPLVLPPTLPISAYPPRLQRRLQDQRRMVMDALRSTGRRGNVEIVRGRSVEAVISAVSAQAAPVELILAGSASWRIRRAVHRLAPFTVVPGAARRRGRLRPATRPVAGS
jgi:hypothetical protein